MAAQRKKIDVKQKKKDEDVVMKAVEAFNRSTILKLTSNLQDDLVDFSKLYAAEAQLKLEEEQRLKAEEALQREKLINKRYRDQICYYKRCLSMVLDWKNVVVNKISECLNSMDFLVNRIEEAFGVMKGAHSVTKAAKLLELISTGLLFNGAGISTLESMHRDYIRNLFTLWKLVYASDMSPAGSF